MNFKERLKAEQADLKDKILKLEKFANSDKIKHLSEKQQEMLRHQLLTMYPYQDVLQLRMFDLDIGFDPY